MYHEFLITWCLQECKVKSFEVSNSSPYCFGYFINNAVAAYSFLGLKVDLYICSPIPG